MSTCSIALLGIPRPAVVPTDFLIFGPPLVGFRHSACMLLRLLPFVAVGGFCGAVLVKGFLKDSCVTETDRPSPLNAAAAASAAGVYTEYAAGGGAEDADADANADADADADANPLLTAARADSFFVFFCAFLAVFFALVPPVAVDVLPAAVDDGSIDRWVRNRF